MTSLKNEKNLSFSKEKSFNVISSIVRALVCRALNLRLIFVVHVRKFLVPSTKNEVIMKNAEVFLLSCHLNKHITFHKKKLFDFTGKAHIIFLFKRSLFLNSRRIYSNSYGIGYWNRLEMKEKLTTFKNCKQSMFSIEQDLFVKCFLNVSGILVILSYSLPIWWIYLFPLDLRFQLISTWKPSNLFLILILYWHKIVKYWNGHSLFTFVVVENNVVKIKNNLFRMVFYSIYMMDVFLHKTFTFHSVNTFP